MTPRVAVERVGALDPALLARCDFSFGPSGAGYPFDPAFTSPSVVRMMAVVRVDARVAGYIACRREGDAAEVRRLEIDQSRRGQGLGRRLLDEAGCWASEQGLSALRLETLADNPAAGRFFSLYGFTLARAADVLHWHLPLRL